jgi:hypothetical protein
MSLNQRYKDDKVEGWRRLFSRQAFSGQAIFKADPSTPLRLRSSFGLGEIEMVAIKAD